MPNKVIKLLFLGLVFLSLGSCSLDNGSNANDFYYEYVPIETVEIAEEFALGQSYAIAYSYYRPSTCHLFNDLFYDINHNIRTIAVINTVVTGDGQTCTDLDNELVTRTFNFIVTSTQTYLFKFWQGTDSEGNDTYLEIEVPVTQ